MQKNIIWILLASCLFAFSCKKNKLSEENLNTANLKKNILLATTAETSAAVSVNAYTNTNEIQEAVSFYKSYPNLSR